MSEIELKKAGKDAGKDYASLFHGPAPCSDYDTLRSKTVGYIEASWKERIVSPLDSEGAPEAMTPERLDALCERLRNLRYAGVPADGADYDVKKQKVMQPLQAFQVESHLAPSGKLDAFTWDSLGEIYTFESPIKVEEWFSRQDGELIPDRSLLRGIVLRLNILGFLENVTDDSFRYYDANGAVRIEIAQAVRDLNSAMTALNIPWQNLDSARDLHALACFLFDFDTLETLISAIPIAQACAIACGPENEEDNARKLLMNVGVIELWLNGYDANPADYVYAPENKSFSLSGDLLDEFDRYFADLGKFPRDELTKRFKTNRRVIIEELPGILIASENLRKKEAQDTSESISKEVVEKLRKQIENKKGEGIWNAIADAAKHAASCLYDGVRRVVRWLGNLVKSAWDNIVSLGKAAAYNLWRFLHHFAGGTAYYFRKAFEALEVGVEFLFGEKQECDNKRIVYHHSLDFDTLLYVDNAAASASVEAFAAKLRYEGNCLAVSARIIGLVIEAVIDVVKTLVSNIGGFYVAIMGLASIYSTIRKIGADLDKLEASAPA